MQPTHSSNQFVQVPQALYNAMAHCFYGSGPRFTDRQEPVVVRPDPDDRLGDLETLNATSGAGPVTIQTQMPAAWKPRGAADGAAAAGKPKPPGERTNS